MNGFPWPVQALPDQDCAFAQRIMALEIELDRIGQGLAGADHRQRGQRMADHPVRIDASSASVASGSRSACSKKLYGLTI